MDNKKFETLIDLIINEQEEKAQELFHEIVVEKSREIYESIMDEEMMDEGMHDSMEGQMVGQVGDLLDEIDVEEAGGMTEEEEEEEEDLEVIDLDSEDEDEGDDHHDDVGGNEELEDRVESLEDKLDYLMAEFEKDMGGEEEVESEEEVEINEAEEDEAVEEAEDHEDDEKLEEAVSLTKVPGLYGSKIGGDNGANPKSPTLTEPKVKADGVKPVKFSGDNEADPKSTPKVNNYGTKGEKEVPGAGNFKNVPGKNNFKDKGEAATKPHLAQATGVNTKSPVAKG